MNYAIEISSRIYRANDTELARLRKLYPNSPDVMSRVRREMARRRAKPSL
jgi:hypothetical protein